MKLKINDIITKCNDTRKVLEVLTQTVLVSQVHNHKCGADWYTEQELLADGWVFPVKKWTPNKDEEYWFVNGGSKIIRTINANEFDRDRISVRNCYATEAEAKEALTRVLAAYKG